MDRRSSPEANGRVHVIHSLAGGLAGKIWNPRLHTDPITLPQVSYFRADFRYYPGSLMPQNHWIFYHIWPYPSMYIIVDITAANTDILHIYFYISRPNFFFNWKIFNSNFVLLL